MLNKHAQVTIFIILGILLVASALTLYITKDYLFTSAWDRNLAKSFQVPQELQGFHEYLLSCISDEARKGAELLGQQGGFIFPVQDQEQALFLSKSLHLPYWFYQASNKVSFEQIPLKQTMEQELERYLNLQIPLCLEAYNSLEEYQFTPAQVQSTVEILDQEIRLTITYPLVVSLKDLEFTFPPFYQSLDVPLGTLYDQAVLLFTESQQTLFFEKRTLDLMGLYDEVPLSGSTFSCVPPLWITSQVITDLKKILSYNLQAYSVKNNENSEYQRFLVPGISEDVAVSFLYSPSFPTDVEILPEGEILQGQSVTESFGEIRGLAESFVCLSTYHFVYDLSYPLVILLQKDDFTFQFATQVVIDHNEPRKRTVTLDEIPEPPVSFCKHRFSDLTVLTVDEQGLPLEGVDVSYKCITTTCPLGITALKEGEASLTTGFPFCVGGFVVGQKQGYYQGKMQTSTLEPGLVSLPLEKLVTLPLTFLVQREGSGLLREGEKIYLTLEEPERGYRTSLVYPDQTFVDLISGTYKGSLTLFSDYPQGLYVEGTSVNKCFLVPKKGVGTLLGQKEEKCIKIDIPGITLDTVLSGKGQFSFSVTSQDLLQAQGLELYVPYAGIPRTVEEISTLYQHQGEALIPTLQ